MHAQHAMIKVKGAYVDSTGIIWFDLKQIAIQTLSTVSYIEKCAL